MAIVIPTSKTYDRQNYKARDNVIERIEVGAVEVVPDNEYETPVYNEKIAISYATTLINSSNDKESKVVFYGNTAGNWVADYASGYLRFSNYKKRVLYITIPYLKNNKWINDLRLKDKIKYTLFGDYAEGEARATWSASINPTSKTINVVEDINSVTYTQVGEPKKTNFNIPEERQATMPHPNGLPEISLTLEAPVKSILPNEYTSTTNGYAMRIELIVGYRELVLFGSGSIASIATNFPNISSIEMNGGYSEFNAETVEITVYGNTIGIDLSDKTVYINGQTQKKVHSVEGNELMQTSNYLLDSGKKAIETMYSQTREDYENGKETATIRCSISDYYDGDQKIIAIDNSTRKMSFDIGDEVIPMVYGADGQDNPMSTYQDGSPKVFQVLGTKIYYDGAVWQELSLQEVDKSKVL